ncbi:conserved hypothetical protein [Candidatus Sulfobium mesophilum]|uniref:DUF5343 domain-containing protein n=1 Tax=Candidatus Sulfobium mesophilum TaxID=2016548 RepID=A0A2U3QEZ7_9BACT|nr:conserved hypothetical protein [Candidatus Sulfobium mesophilum]
MALPDSYTLKPNAIPAYFDAILDAQPPERFSVKFLENLGFTSTNDRLFIGILKDLGFLNRDGAPQSRYFQFLDRSRSKQTLAEGIKEAFADLFAINTKANELAAEEIKNKLRTLYAGSKTDLVIGSVAKTFRALCDYADFSNSVSERAPVQGQASTPSTSTSRADSDDQPELPPNSGQSLGKVTVSALQYHVNVVLPETRDQAVYDAIFKSLREHLGMKQMDLYSFVYRGILTEEALDQTGRRRRSHFGDEDARKLQQSLSFDFLDPDLLAEGKRMSVVYAAIHAFENTVRSMVTKAMSEKHSSTWWGKVPERIQKTSKTRMEEDSKFRWHGARGSSEIDLPPGK